MASGRMITNAIPADKKINQLSDDTSRLAFTWLITFADSEGRTYGDPGVVRSMLFPRRSDVTIEQMEGYIREWHNLGLVVWYEADGDQWIWFPKFDKNQPGLRKDREAPSRIPAYVAEKLPPGSNPPPDELRSGSGPDPEEIPVKLKEVKLKEWNSISADLLQYVPTSPKEAADHPIFWFYKSRLNLEWGFKNYKLIIDSTYYLWHNVLKEPPLNDLETVCKGIFVPWCQSTTREGRPYDPTNPVWLTDYVLPGRQFLPVHNGNSKTPPTPADQEAAKLAQQRKALYG